MTSVKTQDAAPATLPIADRYLEVLAVLCERLPLPAVNWALTGSVGHRLQGVDVEIHDVDVQTDADGALQAAERLREHVVAAPRWRESELMRSLLGALRIHDVTVELMGAIQKRPGPGHPWTEPTDPAAHRVIVRRNRLAIPALSLDYEAGAYASIGRHERAELLRAAAKAWREGRGHGVIRQ